MHKKKRCVLWLTIDFFVVDIFDIFFDVFEIVSYLSKDMTLYPGDIIACGTNSGLGPMHENDVIEIEIESIGRISNKLI